MGPFHTRTAGAGPLAAIFGIERVLLRIGLAGLLPVVPAFRQDVSAQGAVKEDRLGISAPGPSQIALVHPGSRRERTIAEHIAVRLTLKGRGGRHITVFFGMQDTVLEVADGGAENKIGRSLNIAIQVIIPLHAPVLSVTAVGVQGVLVPDKAAAVEEEEITVGKDGHRLVDALSLTCRILEGQVLEGYITRMNINTGTARSPHLEITARP